MRLFTLGQVLLFAFSSICFTPKLYSQSCLNTGLNGTVINLPCNQNCVNIPVHIPHLKSTDDYTVVSVPYTPFQYVTAAPALVYPSSCSAQFQDDKYYDTTFMPFSFCFYGAQYSKLVVGTNGLITFDINNALQGGNWDLTTGGAIPFTGSGSQGLPPCPSPSGVLYPRASIMGAFYDIDISQNTSATKKMEVHVEGSAPCRKFVISFFEVPLFSCTSQLCSQQIVLYESTGVVDVYIGNKPACTGWNNGKAILGMQNWNRDRAIAAPGKNWTSWSESNTGYRFVPSGGASRFVNCDVQDINGNFIAHGDTITTTPGVLDVTFPSFCPTSVTGQYVVKTTFTACDNAANQLVSYDTITINKTNNLNATATTAQTSCGVNGTGTATITVPSNLGLPPYTFVLAPGNITHTSTTGTTTFSALTAGAYTVNVTDAGGCSSAVPVTITSTGVLSVDFNTVNTTCVGAANGSITANATNATPPIQYSINGGPYTANNTFNNLAPGTYFLSAQDNGGCSATFVPVTIDPGPSITMTYTTTPTSCQGASNGTVTLNPTGTAPFQYAINGGSYQTSNTFTGLQATTYFVDVKDAQGCTITFFPVDIPAGSGTVTGTAAAIPTSCAGVNNGSIAVTPTSGVGPYEYSINGGTTWQTSNTFNNLAPGSYNVIIREGGQCISNNIAASIAAGNGLQGTLATTPTTCPGVNNGSITVTPTSGTGPYVIKLDGTRTQTGTPTTTFTGVGAGTHSVTITDANGCVTITSLTATVSAGTGYSTSFTATNISCMGVNNGSLLITPQVPGTSPYTFVMNPGAVTQTGATNTTFTGLAPGTYSVVVTDAAGCQSTVSNMAIAQGAGLTGTLTPSSTSCNGATNGSIAVTPTSGTAPYTFVLDGTRTQTGATTTFTNVGSGTHTVTITDANGCVTTAPLSTTVAAGTGFTANFTANPTSCVGVNNGSLTITPQAPASSPYTFVMTPGGVTQTGPANTTFTGLAPGTYSVLVTDAAGCQVTVSNMAITQGAGLQANTVVTAAKCFGSATGVIDITPTTGSGPYTFVLNSATTQTGMTTTTFNNLTANTYTITITDAAGCISAPIVKTITEPTMLTAPTPAALPVTCNGASNGTITVIPAGGVPPYLFSLDNVNYQAANAFNVAQGAYTVYIKDANGCMLQFSNVQITQPAALNAAVVSTTNSTCNGGNDGAIEVGATGGTAPYQYSTDGTSFQSSNILNVMAGTYSVTVKDVNNCTFVIAGVVVGLTDNLTLSTTDPAPICEGSSVQLQPASNATGYAWYYTGVTSLSSNAVANPTASPATTTTYTVMATLGGCTKTADITVTVMPAPVPDAGPVGDICFGQNYQLQGSGGVTYTWSPSTYLDNPNIANPQSVRPDHTITYTLSVIDANNCPSLVPDNVIVNVTPPIRIYASTVDTVMSPGSQFQIQLTSVGTDYVWSPTTGLSDPYVPNPVITAPDAGETVIYTVITKTAAGCQGEQYVTVKSYKGPEIYVPNAFTPNNDGRNDSFIPFPVGIKKLNYFRVFNRWGQLVFSTTTLNKGWDGKFGGVEQGNGVYVWMVQGITETGTVITKNGTVMLIR